MLHPAYVVVLGHAAGAVLLGWLYFRRYAMTRPPLGVLNLWDVALMIGAIILVPYLYLILPLWAVLALLMLGTGSILYFTGEPLLHARWALWLAVFLLLGADLALALWFGVTSTPAFAGNNLVLTVAVVGVTNLWAQSGLKARDAAILGGALTIYDFVATALLPLMTDLFTRLAGLPLAPVVAWRLGDEGIWLGIGLGDLLLATVFPLVMRKAFGRTAGLAALIVGLGVIAAMLALTGPVTLPVMVVLGPLMVLQYLYWRRRGPERPTWRYWQEEPHRRKGRLPLACKKD